MIVYISFQILQGFDEHMKSLTPTSNIRNPWFSEYWETFFGCHMDRRHGQDLACSDERRITENKGYQQDSKVRKNREANSKL